GRLDEDTSSVGADYARDLGHRRATLLDLLQPVVAQAGHALAHRDVADRLSGAAFQRERLDLGGHLHHLVQADAAAIAAATAAPAAGRLVGLELHARPVAVLLQRLR